MTIAQLGNRGGMSSTTVGTGDVLLGAALGAVPPNVCSYIDFASAGLTNGQLVSYLILDSNGAWECGRATFSTIGPQITGRTVSKSSNSNAAINLTGSGVQVFISALTEDIGPSAVLHVDAAQTLTSGEQAQARSNIFKGPTVQTLTATAGSPYNTPANALWLEVWIFPGGGGGHGVSTSVNTFVAGSDGVLSSFNSVNANPGKGATGTTVATGVAGLGGTGGTGAATRRYPGQPGGQGMFSDNSATTGVAGAGGGNLMHGGTASVAATTVVGNSAPANSGAGGSSASNVAGSNNQTGCGGGGGECAYLIINNPAATYNYSIGAGGAGGVSSSNGGAGGSGVIHVVEHYI